MLSIALFIGPRHRRQHGFERLDFRRDGIFRGFGHSAIGRKHGIAGFGQCRAATRASAARRFDDRFAESAVHRFDQRPGPLVAHLHGTAGGGDGAGFANAL